MSVFGDLGSSEPMRIWPSIAGRVIEGERCTLAVIELDAGSVVPEHAHDNEQLGVCLSGSMRFTVDGETQEVGPGSTWSIPPNVPHDVVVGNDGCVVAEVFVPSREDWAPHPREEPRAPRWP